MVAPADIGVPPATAAPTARATILSVRDLVKHFPIRAGFVRRTVGEVHAVCESGHRGLAVHGGAVVGLAADRGTLQRRLQIGDAVVADDK